MTEDELFAIVDKTMLSERRKIELKAAVRVYAKALLQQTPCKTHVCHHCGGVDGHTIECTAWCGKTVTV